VIGCTPWWRSLWELATTARERVRNVGGRTLLHDLVLDAVVPAGNLAFVAFVMIGSSMKLAAGTHNPFIYFRF
jgi:hypothetical protein